MGKTWRDVARPIIQQTIAENKDKSAKEIRIALRNAYPFGERKYHPYKVWCDEVLRQLDIKKNKVNENTDQLKLL